MSENMTQTISDNTVLVSVGTHRMGITRKVKKERTAEYAASSATEPSMLKASKDLVDSPEYDEIKKRDGEFYRDMMRRVIDSKFRRGTYLLPIGLLDWFEEFYAKYEAERSELVEKFLGVYEERVQEAQEKLGDNYDPQDYPVIDAVRASFYLEKEYGIRSTPDKLREINPAIYGKERQRLQKAMEEASREVRLALRKGLLDLVEHLQEKLEPSMNGKKKRLHESTVGDLKEWLDLFSARNVTNDVELDQLSEKLKTVLAGADRDVLRDNKAVRESVQLSLKSASRSLDAMVKEGPRRRLRLKD